MPNAPQGTIIGTINTDRSQLMDASIGLRADIHNSGEAVDQFFPLECYKVPDCSGAGDWVEVSNSFNSVGVKIGQDTVVGMGNPTSDLGLWPTAGFSFVAGRFVSGVPDDQFTTALATRERTQWEYRPLEFGSPLQPDDQIMCRVKGLNGYENVKTLTLKAPLEGLFVTGIHKQ